MKLLLASLSMLVAGSAHAGAIWVDVTPLAKSRGDYSLIDKAVKNYNSRIAKLSEKVLDRRKKAGNYDPRIPLSIPAVARLKVNGSPVAPVKRGPGDITLKFETSGSRAFPAEYRALLESVFNSAKSTMNVVFGMPASGGEVLVSNYDADIQDRYAVAGGYFLPNNGAGQPEIRFPVYVSPEAAAVNFIHTLLLAYLGPNGYEYDAFQEGLVRAATMRIVRTAGALPNTLDPGLLELTLDNTYDVGTYYDWYNQRALGASQFIANNLLNLPLPGGGSLGGIYLLRYQMAGSAWQKVIAEYPAFISSYNQALYSNPSLANNVPALVNLGQTVLNSLGGANAKIEGLSFADWFRRQYILETQNTLGEKLLIQPIPITGGLGGTDFGVFDVSATYFESQAGNNEVLLSGTSFPIFWDQSFNRIFPGTQVDSMDIAGAYGSVTPNLPDINGGKIYRATADVPVGDRIARAYLPVGAIATPSNPTPNNFYGTVIGLTLASGQTGRVRVSVGNTVLAQPNIINGAFGGLINNANYNGYAKLKVEVIRRQGTTDTVVYTRNVNKGPGPLALDLRVNGDTTVNHAIAKGIQALGTVVDPWASQIGELFGLTESQVLAAKYNPTTSGYDLYPNGGGFVLGAGLFHRAPAAKTVSIAGRTHPGTPVAVSLKPGWNLVTNPLNEDTGFERVQVVKSSFSPVPWNDAVGTDIGAQIFQFVPGPNDPASGAPETGSYVSVTNFQKGKATFVRVLAPEGVTLLFTPSTMAAKPGRTQIYTGWRVMGTLANGATKSAAVFGQTTTATNNFDNREDSPLPPLYVNGLRATVVASSMYLYRDVRPLGSAQTYRVRFDGLKTGQTYTVTFTKDFGTPPSFVLKDTVSLKTQQMSVGQSYSFVARSTAHQLDLVVAAGSK